MMTRGRKPKPTGRHKVEGTYRHDRHGDRATAKPGVPTAPAKLSAEAKVEWQRVIGELAAANLLAKLDRSTLALYCEAWADYWAAKLIVQKEGWTAVGSTGNVIEHPAVKAMQRAWEQCLKAGCQFGMTPSARGSIKMAPVEGTAADADEKEFF